MIYDYVVASAHTSGRAARSADERSRLEHRPGRRGSVCACLCLCLCSASPSPSQRRRSLKTQRDAARAIGLSAMQRRLHSSALIRVESSAQSSLIVMMLLAPPTRGSERSRAAQRQEPHINCAHCADKTFISFHFVSCPLHANALVAFHFATATAAAQPEPVVTRRGGPRRAEPSRARPVEPKPSRPIAISACNRYERLAQLFYYLRSVRQSPKAVHLKLETAARAVRIGAGVGVSSSGSSGSSNRATGQQNRNQNKRPNKARVSAKRAAAVSSRRGRERQMIDD